jgi:hypothetical protein
VLNGENAKKAELENVPQPQALPFASLSFGQLCKFGLAMTWPFLAVGLGVIGLLIAILLRR